MSVASTQEHRHQRARRPSGEPPPLPRSLKRVATAWMIALAAFAGLWLWVFLSDTPAIWITKRDMTLMDSLIGRRSDGVDTVAVFFNGLVTHWGSPILGWVTLVTALATRRIRHALLLIGSLSLVAGVVNQVAAQIRRPRPLGVEAIGDWQGFAQPSRPMALLAAVIVAAGLSIFTPRFRILWFWIAGSLAVISGFAQVYTGVEHPTDVFAGATAGVALTFALYRILAPEVAFPISYRRGRSAHLDIGGARGEAIRVGLRRQLNIDATLIEPVGWESSAGSTPLRIESAAGDSYFGKLYARNHLRSDRSYKLVRNLLYGQLEDERAFASVRRLVQHEDYMLHVMTRVGLRCAEPYGIVEITPEREYLLVTEFVEEAFEISHVDVTDDIIDDALEQVAILWRSGLAHRDIKPSNVMVRAGRVLLVDAGFAQIRPSPWRQAVDLANMMLVLALRTSPEQVFARARLAFAEHEIAEAFAASRGITLPTQLRAELRRDERDLSAAFRSLAPRRRPVVIQRWSLRRIGLSLWVVILAVFIVGTFMSGLGDIGMR